MPAVVKGSSDVKAEPVARAAGTEIQWLISKSDGAPNFDLRKFTLAPGGKIPKHFHDDIEHEQFVLKGEYVLGVDEKTYKLKPGDSIFIPARSVHWYQNTGDEQAEFLCIVPRREKYDATYLEEASTTVSSNKSCT